MKIGIITHFYKSENFGGLLQAYALQKYFEKRGAICKQICYKKIFRFGFIGSAKQLTKKILVFLKNCIHLYTYNKFLSKKRRMKKFRKSIPHTNCSYTLNTIDCIKNDFDIFITGSDQVWSPSVIDDAYLLNFTTKKKASYAASVASNLLDQKALDSLSCSLNSYNSISIRERNSFKFIQNNLKPQLVLDPVFLLDSNEWRKKASKRMIKEEYALCYFLGLDMNNLVFIKQYAKEKGLKIVNICYTEGFYKKNDFSFADINLIDLDPDDFLSLIAYCNTIFTDSFHAIAFSYIFKKNFYAFNRKSKTDMSSRIKDLLITLNLETRYCENFSAKPEIDYNELSTDVFSKIKEDSIHFLDEILI